MSAAQCLVACTLFLMAFLGCATAAAPTEGLPVRLLAKGNFSGFTEAKKEIISKSAEWERAWAKLSVRLKDPDKLPAVDFTKEMVILVTMGQQRTGGYAIEITKVEEAAGKLRIYVKQREPSPGGFTIQSITSPFHAVAVPKRDLKPEFVEIDPKPK